MACLGLKIPKTNIELVDGISVTEEDIIALSRRIDENSSSKKITEQWKKPWVESQISAAHIILTATRLNESITDAIKQFQKFTPVGLEIINVDADTLGTIDITPEDVIILSKHLNGEEAVSKNYISPAHIVFAAKKLNEPIANTLKRFQEFIPIGLKLPNVDLELLGNLNVTHDDLFALSENFKERMDGETPLYEERVNIAQLIQISQCLSESLIDTLKRLERFKPLGLKLPKVDMLSIDGISVTREDMIAFSDLSVNRLPEYSRGGSSWVEDRVTPAHIITASIKLNESVAIVRERFLRFTPLGLEVPLFDLESLEALITDKQNLIAFSKNLLEKPNSTKDLLQGYIHPTRIILAALALEEPLAATLERFRRFAPVLGLTLPKGEPESWRFCVNSGVE